MASGSLVGQSDAREQQEKGYSRKNQSKTKIPKSVPHRYNQEQYSQKILVNTTDDNIPVASDDSSSQPGAHNCREPSHGKAIPGYAKFDSFVKISFDLSNREEARALRRKLASELDQVMTVLRRLETTEIQLSKTVDRNAATISVNKNGNSHGSESGEKVTMAPKMNQFYQNLEVVGSEKLSTLEGNKKLKSNYNIKGNGFVSIKDFSRLFKSCRNLLERLMKHKYGWVFNKPVDVKGLGLHDYYTIIKHPMDLGTVKHRLSKNLYKSPTEFAEDVRLTFRNAMLYNPKGQDVHIMAEGLSKIFEETWTKLEAEHNCSRPLKTGRDSSLASCLPKKVPACPAPVRTHSPAPAPAPACPAPVRTHSPAHLAPVHTPAPLAPVRTPAPAPLAPDHTRAPAPPPPTPVLTTSPAPPPPPPAPVHTTTPASPVPVHSPAPCLWPLEMRTLERVESVTMPKDLKTEATNLAHQERTLVRKKPKAKSPDKMDMTYEEKHRLSLNLQELPSDKLDNVVQIIKKRNPVLSQQDDEIEVDIDSFDPETLWELDRFVTNYKKSLSRDKGNAEVAHQATAEAEHNILERNLEPLIPEAPKETEAVVEKIVSTSLPVLEEKHGHNANESSSSSGSSSDSGPSSIGSDCGSSSGYRSPADKSNYEVNGFS